MSETSDENTNTGTTQTEQEVTLDDVRQLEKGDAIALRVTQEETHQIAAGELSAEPRSDAEMDEQLEEYDAATIVLLDLDLWWGLSDGDLTDYSHRLEEWPPSQPFRGGPQEEAPPCRLEYLADGTIGLVIPTPIYRGSSMAYIHLYDTRPSTPVVELESGDIVDPQGLVPDEYDHVL